MPLACSPFARPGSKKTKNPSPRKPPWPNYSPAKPPSVSAIAACKCMEATDSPKITPSNDTCATAASPPSTKEQVRSNAPSSHGLCCASTRKISSPPPSTLPRAIEHLSVSDQSPTDNRRMNPCPLVRGKAIHHPSPLPHEHQAPKPVQKAHKFNRIQKKPQLSALPIFLPSPPAVTAKEAKGRGSDRLSD